MASRRPPRLSVSFSMAARRPVPPSLSRPLRPSAVYDPWIRNFGMGSAPLSLRSQRQLRQHGIMVGSSHGVKLASHRNRREPRLHGHLSRDVLDLPMSGSAARVLTAPGVETTLPNWLVVLAPAAAVVAGAAIAQIGRA